MPRTAKSSRSINSRSRRRQSRPFWLPAISYYVLAAAVSGVVFFLIWGILIEGGEDVPWVTAGIAASLLMIAAVIVREVVLRGARRRFLEAERRLDRNLKKIPVSGQRSGRRKLTFEENKLMLAHISMKSEAARVLHDVGAGHHEVFQLCEDYLRLTEDELRRTDVNSPRYVAMRKGRRRVKRLHKYHLLTWSEIESRALSAEARDEILPSDGIGKAAKALQIVEEATRYYPLEEKLIDSASALREFIDWLKVSGLISEAEQFEAAGEHLKAFETYEVALEAIRKGEIEAAKRDVLEERVGRRLAALKSSGH